MPAIPGKVQWHFVVQDDRGFRANVRVVGGSADLTLVTTTTATSVGDVGAFGTALQAATNAKVVSTGYSITWDYAQEPSTETGTYQLVIQGAHMEFGSGRIEREFMTVPAPKDGLFLTTGQDNLIVVDPTSSLLAALQSAATPLNTPDGGVWGAQFFGGQLREGKPRRRRVLQGA